MSPRIAETGAGSMRVAPQTTASHALAGLREAIVEGRLRPGQRVLQEILAAELGVSVTAVREALAALAQEGQVRYFPRRGYFVAELSVADLEEIYALRAVIENEMAARAIDRLDPAAETAMREAAAACEAAAAAGDVSAELTANRRFHFALLAASGQPRWLKVVGQLWDLTEAYRALYYNSAHERQRSLEAHERILAAVGSGDGGRLVEELASHREEALRFLREVLEAGPTPPG